jgi:predicted ester cyclase
MTIEDLIAEGDLVSFRVTYRGTHLSSFMGIAPTKKLVFGFAFEIVRIENGKMTEHWGGPDMLNLLQQLGMNTQS